MRKIVRNAIVFLLIVSIMSSAALAARGGTGAPSYSNTTELTEGFRYTNEITYNAAGKRVETFMLDAGAASGVYPIVSAGDTIYGGLTEAAVIRYAEAQGRNVLAAVNADFFSMATGVPLGIVIEDGVYRSSPEDEGALYFGDKGAGYAERVAVDIALKNEESGESVSLRHFNKYRNDGGGLYLYSADFSTVSTRTYSDGWTVKFKVLDGVMTVSGQMALEVVGKSEGSDAVPIGEGYMVLSADTTSDLYHIFSTFSLGDRVTLTTACDNEAVKAARWATGCGDLLVSDGEVTDSSTWDSALFGYNPRTVIGLRKDGSVVAYAADGRNAAYSNGAKLSETVGDLTAMGCDTVVNLDGGASTAMSVRLPGSDQCTLVNAPSGGSLRRCASYILFVTDAVPDGEVKHLFLAEDGVIVLAGSSLELSCFASDAGLKQAEAPDVIAMTSAGLGTISDGIYTAGDKAGTDTVTLSAGGVTGTGTIHIITAADAISVTDALTDKEPELASVENGSSCQLEASLSYLTRPFIMDEDAVTYAVSGDVGTITADGVFTAQGAPGAAGEITVSAAGMTARVPVSIRPEFLDIIGHWAEAYIDELFDAGITNGVTATQFAPDNEMKRGDFVLMLWRAAGRPAAGTGASFTDVKSTDYYADAIVWAAEKGIAQGRGDGRFWPEDSLTREDAFTFIYRALGVLGFNDSDGAPELLEKFTDNESVSDYARVPMATLISLGIVEGSGGRLAPQDHIRRCEMAKVLCVAILSKG